MIIWWWLLQEKNVKSNQQGEYVLTGDRSGDNCYKLDVSLLNILYQVSSVDNIELRHNNRTRVIMESINIVVDDVVDSIIQVKDLDDKPVEQKKEVALQKSFSCNWRTKKNQQMKRMIKCVINHVNHQAELKRIIQKIWSWWCE